MPKRLDPSQSGYFLLELALVMAVLALLIPTLMRLTHAQHQQTQVALSLNDRLVIEKSLEGFVLAHGRLPCPATTAGGREAKAGEGCELYAGALPLASLGLSHLQREWILVTTALNGTGANTALAFHNPRRWERTSLQQLSEVVLSPTTAQDSLEGSALPAIHLCAWQANSPLPDKALKGCGALPLISPTAVAVAYPVSGPSDAQAALTEANASRLHQFFVEQHSAPHNPVWLTYERMVFLWGQGAWLNNSAASISNISR